MAELKALQFVGSLLRRGEEPQRWAVFWKRCLITRRALREGAWNRFERPSEAAMFGWTGLDHRRICYRRSVRSWFAPDILPQCDELISS